MSTDTLKMDLKLPMGRGTSTESSCLMRPFLRLFRTGKPPGKINYIFYRHIDKSAYNLGSLCYSEGGRILFFPGFQATDASQKEQNERKAISCRIQNAED